MGQPVGCPGGDLIDKIGSCDGSLGECTVDVIGRLEDPGYCMPGLHEMMAQ